MTDYQIRRTDTTTTLVFEPRLIQNLNDQGNIPFTTIEADDPVRNQQVSFSNKTRQVTVECILYDNGEDVSDGSFSDAGVTDNRISDGTVVTPKEQAIWLKEYIHASTLGASWVLNDGALDVDYSDPDGDGTLENTPVVISDVSISRDSTNPLIRRASITLKLGQRV